MVHANLTLNRYIDCSLRGVLLVALTPPNLWYILFRVVAMQFSMQCAATCVCACGTWEFLKYIIIVQLSLLDAG
jgi:hypothetical protein